MKLTPLRPEDFPVIQGWLSDESLFHLLAGEPPPLDRPYYVFSVRLDDGTLVGWASVSNIDLWNLKAEVGLALPHKRARGRSLAVLARLLEFCFVTLGLWKVRMRIRGANEQALKLAEGPARKRFGLEKEGVDRYGYWRNEETDDIYYFGITKEVWMKHGDYSTSSHRRSCFVGALSQSPSSASSPSNHEQGRSCGAGTGDP